MDTRVPLGALAALVVLVPASVAARSHFSGWHSGHSSAPPRSTTVATSHSPSHSSYHAPSATSSHHRKTYSALAERDDKGQIARSQKAKDAFKRSNPCPSTGKRYGSCQGYVIDHVVPLKRGGRDDPGNMQWQTQAAAKAKDRWE